MLHVTGQKMKFSIKDFFSECDQSLMENFIFCTLCSIHQRSIILDILLRQISVKTPKNLKKMFAIVSLQIKQLMKVVRN